MTRHYRLLTLLWAILIGVFSLCPGWVCDAVLGLVFEL